MSDITLSNDLPSICYKTSYKGLQLPAPSQTNSFRLSVAARLLQNLCNATGDCLPPSRNKQPKIPSSVVSNRHSTSNGTSFDGSSLKKNSACLSRSFLSGYSNNQRSTLTARIPPKTHTKVQLNPKPQMLNLFNPDGLTLQFQDAIPSAPTRLKTSG